MSKLLVHCCCVHCSAYTLKYWREQGHDVTAFWYNPNIHPFAEHQHRLEALKTLAANENIPLEIHPGYELESYFRAVIENISDRCSNCYRIRLQAAANYAKEHGFDAFTSSLLISPKQKHGVILNISLDIQRSSGLGFEYADLRKKYSDSRTITKPMDLYRQQYCGCLFSERERYGNAILPVVTHVKMEPEV
jgi:epoxyqueuosine reductase